MLSLYNLVASTFSPTPSTPNSHPPPPIAIRLHEACISPSASIAHLPTSAMRRELDATKHDLARANADLAKLDERCKMLDKTLKDTRDLLRARDAELDRLRRDRDRPHNRHGSDVPRELAPRHSSIDIRSTASIGAGALLNGNGNGRHSSHHRHHHRSPPTPPPAEEIRALAHSADTFLTRLDSWSGAQVLQAVHDINAEILQYAAAATELCVFSPPTLQPQNPVLRQATHDTSARIGPLLTRVLSQRDHSQDPILVQLALQSCVSLCVVRAFSAFCIGFPSKQDAVLAQIYAHMHLTEPQPTSSKWRALTHQRIHAMYPTLLDYSTSELSDTIIRYTSDILLVAGCSAFDPSVSPNIHRETSTSPPTSASPSSSPNGSNSTRQPTPHALRASVRGAFTSHVHLIARAACRLARVTREDILSTCFELVAAEPGRAFEGGGMTDAFGEYGASRGAVMGTMEVGLRCVTRLDSEGDGDGEVRLEGRMLLQPKVVLESVLDVLDPR